MVPTKDQWVTEYVEVSVPEYHYDWVDYDPIDGMPAHEANHTTTWTTRTEPV